MIDNNIFETQIVLYKKIISILGDNLKLFSFVGSSSTKTFIANWSDIDILLIINSYNDEQLFKVFELNSEFRIKVGISILTIEDINNDRVDNKNIINLYLIKTGKLIPQYISPNLDFGSISVDEHIIKEKAMRAHYLTLIKNIIYKDDRTIDTRNFLKYCINIIKINLIEKGILARTYDEIIFELSKVKTPEVENVIRVILSIPNVNYDDICIIAKYIIKGEL
ncbi:TPA: hypothetical protein QFH18_002571 [Enterococcus faecium]|nr:hypothetical protein [Enterococcus faecium]